MKTLTASAALGVSMLMAGCGGGGPNAGTCYGSDEVCFPDQSNSSTAVTIPTYCGYQAGQYTLTGVVSNVHDGDTVTVVVDGKNNSIRLDSIDAPELTQPYGVDSRDDLAARVLNQSVTVAYTKRDQYDRIVGAIFGSGCEYFNLYQVAAGNAWFYKAYQCEISAELRGQFAAAQNNASANQLGLWALASPEAPWFYRNGTEPVTPTCNSDLPLWATSYSPPVTQTVAGGTSSGTGSSTCYVGPRGGTYTLTANGNKNYGGC